MSEQGISKSANKLVPNNPTSQMVIRDLIPNRLVTFSTPFLRFGLIKVGGRATAIKLKTGNIAVFSPVALTSEVQSKISELSQSSPAGTVKYLIAPDFEHHIFISPWSNTYTDANVIGVDGLPEKREKDPATKGVKFTHVFTEKNKTHLKISDEFDEEFEWEYVHSHQNKELVLFHKPSRTLIEADLLFNLPANEQFSKSGQSAQAGLMTRFFNALTNTKGDMVWQRRFLYYGPGAMDRKGFAASAKRMQSWGQFDRIIPCHGDVIETGGSQILDKATAWFREKY